MNTLKSIKSTLTFLLLVSYLSNVVAQVDFNDQDYDTDWRLTRNEPEKQKNAIKDFAALPLKNEEVALKWIASNVDLEANTSIRVEIYETDQSETLLTETLHTNTKNCKLIEENADEAVCQQNIKNRTFQCANLIFKIENMDIRARASTIAILPGTAFVNQTGDKTLLHWSISCEKNLMTPVHLVVASQLDTNETMSLEGGCTGRVCSSTIPKDELFKPCIIYQPFIDGYSDAISPFFHRSTAQALSANVAARNSNQTLVITARFNGTEQRCTKILQAVNVFSPDGLFQRQTVPCLSENHDSSTSCSHVTHIPNEAFICQSELTLIVQSVYGGMNYTLDSGQEYAIAIEKPADWDGGKTVRNLQVNTDGEDVIIQWLDPLCATEGSNSMNMKLTTGSLTSGNQMKQRIPAKCSKREEHNQVRISKGSKLVCQNSSETSSKEDFKLMSCLNYSLSVTPFVLGEAFKSKSFITPFRPQDITHFTYKSIPSGLELQWKMPEGCSPSTELVVKVDNSSYRVRPFETTASSHNVTTSCQAKECLVHWTLKENIASCSKYLIQIGSAQKEILTLPGTEDYLFGEAPQVNISRKNDSLTVLFTVDGSTRPCVRYLNALEVVFKPSRIRDKWTLRCSQSHENAIECSHSESLGYMNACINHTVSYRPIFSLSNETQTIWNTETMPPVAKSSKLLGVPAMLVQSENLNQVSVKWRDPRCLFGNVVSWSLSIETDTKNVYSADIPFYCSRASKSDDEYGHSIQIKESTIECNRGEHLIVEKLELVSCKTYVIKLSPVIEMFNKSRLRLIEFNLIQNVSTNIEHYDVQELSVTDVQSNSFNIELTVPSKCPGFNVQQLKINGEVKNSRSLGVIETVGCTSNQCKLRFKTPLKAVPYSNYNVSVGNHIVKFTTSRELYGQQIMDELKNSSIEVMLVEGALQIAITTRGCATNCKVKLESVVVKLFDNHAVLFETLPCQATMSNASETSIIQCLKAVPIKAMNGCRENELFLRPIVPEEDLGWINYQIKPFYVSEERNLQIDAVGSLVEIHWRTPHCLITSQKISSWNLVIANETNVYPLEFPNHCSIESETEDIDTTLHKLKMKSGEINCDSHKFSSLIQLKPCSKYSAKIFPTLDFHEHYAAVAFSESATFHTLPELDVQVMNASAETFEIAFSYPAECSNLREMRDILNNIRISSHDKIIDLTQINESMTCDAKKCRAHWNLEPEALETSTPYSISIGSQEQIMFFTLPACGERTPKNVSVVKETENTSTIEWSIPAQLINRVIGYRVRVTDENGVSVIKNVPATENTFDIHIPNWDVNSGDRATNRQPSRHQRCPLFAYQVGAVWPAGLGNHTAWTESRPLNRCHDKAGLSAAAVHHNEDSSRISSSLIIALSVFGGALLASVILVAAIHFARKTGYWQVEN